MLKMFFDMKYIPEGMSFTEVEASRNFDSVYNPDDLQDELCKEIIKEIDKSEVISPYNIYSPVLGSIPPKRISGGSKALMLAYKYNYVICTANLGDNCVNMLGKISDIMDVYVLIRSFMDIPIDFFTKHKVTLLETGKIYTDYWDYRRDYESFNTEGHY